MEESTIKFLIIGIGFILVTAIMLFRKRIWHFIKETYLDFTTVKIYVGGMIPFETRLALIDDNDNKKLIFNELCDENGEFNYRVKRKHIGKNLRFPIRQSPFEFTHEEKIILQPWGHFEAVKMQIDYSDLNKENMSYVAKRFDSEAYASEKYYEALYKSQYLARNQTNKTKWFFMAAFLGVMGALIGSGLELWQSISISIFILGIRAYLTNKSYGFDKKPIN